MLVTLSNLRGMFCFQPKWGKFVDVFMFKELKFFLFRLRNIFIVTCSNRDTSPRDLSIMTFAPGLGAVLRAVAAIVKFNKSLLI